MFLIHNSFIKFSNLQYMYNTLILLKLYVVDNPPIKMSDIP